MIAGFLICMLLGGVAGALLALSYLAVRLNDRKTKLPDRTVRVVLTADTSQFDAAMRRARKSVDLRAAIERLDRQAAVTDTVREMREES